MAKSKATVTLSTLPGRDSVELPPLVVRAKGPTGAERTLPLGLSPILVGSATDCELTLQDPGVSRHHCRIELTEHGIQIDDLDSKNGTFISGVRVLSAVLNVGAHVSLGGSELVVEHEGGPATTVALSSEPELGGALGRSVRMRALFEQLRKAASTDQPILLVGASGTGKELLARAVHAHSRRHDKPFVIFDCGAITASLIEAELFGHVKGAFTGATTDRAGLLEQANGGTLLLDEVADFPLDLQPRLLRALESGEVRRVGSDKPVRLDVRIIASSQHDLAKRVEDGAFRRDLYFRLCVVEANVPTLRERREDIPLLVEHFLKTFEPPRDLSQLPPNALQMLRNHDWPGNVRELKNTVTRLVLFGGESVRNVVRTAGSSVGDLARLPLRHARDLAIAEFERRFVAEKLAEHRGNVTAAATAMGVSRQFLHRLITKYDLE